MVETLIPITYARHGHFPPASSNPNLHPVFGKLAFSQLCKLSFPKYKAFEISKKAFSDGCFWQLASMILAWTIADCYLFNASRLHKAQLHGSHPGTFDGRSKEKHGLAHTETSHDVDSHDTLQQLQHGLRMLGRFKSRIDQKILAATVWTYSI